MKEIFKRMMPACVGGVVGVFGIALLLCVFNMAELSGALSSAAIAFLVYACVQYYLVRKDILEEELAEHTVITPLPIVYVEYRELSSKPYLDLNKLDKVWGIAVKGTFFKATLETIAFTDFIPTYSKVQNIISENNKCSPHIEYTLPSAEIMEYLKKHREPFAATILLLKNFGLKASDWKDVSYWCLGKDNQPAMINFNPRDALGVQPVEENTQGFLRLVQKTD